MSKLVLALLTVSACTNFTPKKVEIARCIKSCVESGTYHFDRIDGTAVANFEKLCREAFVGAECCTSQGGSDYYVRCQ